MSKPLATSRAPAQSRVSIYILGDPETINPVMIQLGRLHKLTGRAVQHLVLEALTDLIAKHQPILQQTERKPQ